MSRLRRLREERGVSLVELVVVLAIMGVVLASLTTVFVRGNKVQTDLDARFRAQSSGRVALDRLRRDVRCASALSGGGRTVTLTLPATCAGGGTVSWCVATAGTRLSLYRQTGATCTAAGVRWADYVTQTATPDRFFTVLAQSPSSLARLTVDLPINVRTQSRLDGYELQDTLVLRNSTRS